MGLAMLYWGFSKALSTYLSVIERLARLSILYSEKQYVYCSLHTILLYFGFSMYATPKY